MRPPDSLRTYVAEHTRPVQPFRRPGQRLLAVGPVLLLVAAVGPAVLGLRSDLPQLGAVAGWGLSAAQILIAAFLVYAAFREVVPGQSIPIGTIWAAIGVAVVLHVGATLWSTALSPEVPPRPETVGAWRFCFTGVVIAGCLALPLLGALLLRGSTARPVLAGLLAGLGPGLTADGGWRLYCNYSQPTHVLPSHGGGALLLALVGLAVGLAIAFVRRSRFRRSPRS